MPTHHYLRRALVCVLVLTAVAGAATETDYFAIFMDGAKSGHFIETRTVEGGKVTSTNTMSLTTNRMGVPITTTVTKEYLETTAGEPLAFKAIMDMSLMSQTIEGAVHGGKMTITTSTGQQQTMDYPTGALMPEGIRLLQKRHGLKPGVRYTLVHFEPSSLRSMKLSVHVLGRKEVDVLNHKETLWEVREQAQEFTGLSYYNDDFKMRKSMMTESGMNMEFVACSKEYALGEADVGVDILAKVLVPSPQPLGDLADAKRVTYRLVLDPNTRMKLPQYDNQRARAAGNDVIITVSVQQPPPAAEMPYAGNDPMARLATRSNEWLNSDDPAVIALARQAVGNTTNAVEAAKKIEAFVHDYVSTKGLTVGYASAAEVAANREGDCSEHAVLAAAMCRAVGIPARVVAGMAYTPEWMGSEHVFVPHTWALANLGGTWVHLDPTFPGGYDLGHIALVTGDGVPADFLSLISSMGAFRIQSVDVER